MASSAARLADDLRDWLDVHLWPCAYSFLAGTFFTVAGAWVWSWFL